MSGTDVANCAPSLCNYAYMLHVGKRDFAKAEELYRRALQVQPHRPSTPEAVLTVVLAGGAIADSYAMQLRVPAA
eukprot:78330-Rhodomonas_salina.1